MILLERAIPATTQEFAEALRALVSGVVTGARPDAVAVTGAFPAIQAVSVDLTGATPLPTPTARATEQAFSVVGEFTADELAIGGRPVGQGHRAVDVELRGRAFRGQFVDAGGNPALRLAGLGEGLLRASIAKSAVQALLVEEGNKAAQAQGVEIKDVQIVWSSLKPGHMAIDVIVKAKKGFLPATLHVRGTVTIDDQLNATASQLSVQGEGMIGGIGAGLIRPRLQQFEGKSFSLLKLPLDDLRVRDVRLLPSEGALMVEADIAG
jgi:hypothetical protein